LSYSVGQGILLQGNTFKGGTCDNGTHPYLIVGVSNTHIDILVLSSSANKLHKQAYASNYTLRNFNPPFIKPSFVKLDSLQQLKLEELNALKVRICAKGQVLNQTELNYILNNYKQFN